MTKRQRLFSCGALSALFLGAIGQTGSAEPLPRSLAVVTAPAPVATLTAADPAPAGNDAPAPDATAVECVAKVIVHEAGNQPRVGQIAVAQVIRTRLRAGRFGDNACAVVNQRGQFFATAAYHPARDDARWSNAVAIAASTLAGEGEEVAPGALFFHTTAAPMTSRVRVAQIADHVFYR